MDPPRAPASDPDQLNAILAQLTQINTLLATQHRRLEALEQVRDGENNDLTSSDPSRVGEEGQNAGALPGGSPAESEGGVPPVQHGIRAVEPWMTDAALSKDPFRPSFKLDGPKDYTVWRFTMIKALDREGLLPFALGTALSPEFPVSGNQEEIRLYYRWKEYNNACETALLSSIGKSQLGLVLNCQTAAEIWSRLENLYLHKSEVNIARLEDELHTLKWKRNTPLESFLQDIDRVVLYISRITGASGGGVRNWRNKVGRPSISKCSCR